MRLSLVFIFQFTGKHFFGAGELKRRRMEKCVHTSVRLMTGPGGPGSPGGPMMSRPSAPRLPLQDAESFVYLHVSMWEDKTVVGK